MNIHCLIDGAACHAVAPNRTLAEQSFYILYRCGVHSTRFWLHNDILHSRVNVRMTKARVRQVLTLDNVTLLKEATCSSRSHTCGAAAVTIASKSRQNDLPISGIVQSLRSASSVVLRPARLGVVAALGSRWLGSWLKSSTLSSQGPDDFCSGSWMGVKPGRYGYSSVSERGAIELDRDGCLRRRGH